MRTRPPGPQPADAVRNRLLRFPGWLIAGSNKMATAIMRSRFILRKGTGIGLEEKGMKCVNDTLSEVI